MTVISDDGWCWALAWHQLGVLVVDCLPLIDLSSVQLGSLSSYVDVIQAVPQVQGLNELISGQACNISDFWITFFLRYKVLLQLEFSSWCVLLLSRILLLFSNTRFGFRYFIKN